MRFRALSDIARNRRCHPICFVSSTVSNNFSSACYSRREYQTEIIRFLTSRSVEQLAFGCGSGISEKPNHTDRDSLICIIWTQLEQICEQSDYWAATTIVFPGQMLRRPPCISTGGRICRRIALSGRLISARKAQFTHSRHHVHLLFLPGITE